MQNGHQRHVQPTSLCQSAAAQVGTVNGWLCTEERKGARTYQIRGQVHKPSHPHQAQARCADMWTGACVFLQSGCQTHRPRPNKARARRDPRQLSPLPSDPHTPSGLHSFDVVQGLTQCCVVSNRSPQSVWHRQCSMARLFHTALSQLLSRLLPAQKVPSSLRPMPPAL